MPHCRSLSSRISVYAGETAIVNDTRLFALIRYRFDVRFTLRAAWRRS